MKKKREHIIHKASTIDTFYSLTSHPQWVKLLLNREKSYEKFLEALIHQDFYRERNERTPIKKMAEDTGFKTTEITKWIIQMYDDIFELNDTNPELFKQNGIKHQLHFKYWDSHAFLTLWLINTPHRFETFDCYFVKAKVGTSLFHVKDIRNSIENGEHTIDISLSGGTANAYREWLVERALFHDELHFMDVFQKEEYEIDEILKKIYRK